MQVGALIGAQWVEVAVQTGDQIGYHDRGQMVAVGSGVDQGAAAVVGVGHPSDQAAVDEPLDGLGGAARGLDGPTGQEIGRASCRERV